MRFARVHKVAAYLLASLGLVALGTGGELNPLAALVLSAGVLASWFAEGEILHSARYVRAWTVAVVAGLFVEIVRWTLLGLPPLSAAIEFAALLQLSRLANRRTATEYQQITVLAMLHLIAATVLGGGLSYAACFIGFVIVTPWAMTLGHLRREIEGNYLADARAGRAGVPIDVARILRSRRVVGPGLLLGSSLLALPIFAMTAVLFVLFPRVGLGVFSVRGGRSNPVAGLGDQVDLAGHGTIRDDPSIVLRIEPPDAPANPPAFRSFRLRGAAFDSYDGRSWTRRPSARHTVPREGGFYALRRWPRPGDDRPFRIVADSFDPPVVLLPPGTTALRVEPRIEAGVPRYPELTTDPRAEVRYAASDDLGLVYTAFAPPTGHPVADPTPLADAAAAGYLAVPPLDPRVLALAHRLTDGVGEPLAKAAAIERYLHGFRYTLALESGDAARPLDDFLLRTRAGHCEYFSTAMAVMLRAVGVPSRNVTGFLGGTYNRYGRFYAVRQGDAHSWVEVYAAPHGWVTFDPTPAAREAPAVRTSALGELDAAIEALRVRWRRYIVGFDLGTQAQLALRVMRALEGRGRRGARGSAGVTDVWSSTAQRARTMAKRPAGYALLSLAGITVLALLALRVRARRAHAPARARASSRAHVREAVALAQALDAALAARGHKRPPTCSPVAFADGLARAGSPLAPLAQRVADRYAAARFGGEPLAPGEYDALRRALREAPNPLS